MANTPTKATAKKIKPIDRYFGDVGIYQLSKGLKRGRNSIKYLVIFRGRPGSGKPVVSVWPSDDSGVVKDFANPTWSFIGKSIAESLQELGYELI